MKQIELAGGGVRAASAGDGEGDSKSIEPVIERVLERVLEKRLDASPGGYLSVLVQDVVESTLSRSKGYGVDDDPYDHVPDDRDSPGDASASEGDDELKQMLRGMVGEDADAGGPGRDRPAGADGADAGERTAAAPGNA